FVRHTDLNSFPTRRSSDLSHRNLTFLESRYVRCSPSRRTKSLPAPLYFQNFMTVRPFSRFIHHDITLQNYRPSPKKMSIKDGRKDRKSTRLNSSHVKISYA